MKSLLRRSRWLAVAALVLFVVPLSAHDMWIEPTTFSPETGRIVGVRLRVGQDLLGDPLGYDPALSTSSSSRTRPAASRPSAAPAPIRPACCASRRPAWW
jgi:hypothetical protein